MTSATQLWFDVPGPVAARAARLKATRREVSSRADQFELRMAAAELPPARPALAPRPAPLPAAGPSTPTALPGRTFGSWLLDQTRRPGSLGELAKAAKGDRLFPRNGSAEDVRRRFGVAGADGDAFEALDDAEREYDRQMS
jgi:hypothetical protein